jgi:hypothetical protein
MLTLNQMQKLQANWGELAEAMECNAEVRVYDPLSHWQAFIYAQNPEDLDQIKVIVGGFTIETCDMTVSELFQMYNGFGECVQVDPFFRPMKAAKLLRMLKETAKYKNNY